MQAAGRLVDEVDGLVRQEPPRHIAVREDRRGDECRVLDADPVVHLVALLQAAQDGDGVLDRRRVDQHRLEAALQGGVLLDVLAVLVQRRRPDHPQLAAGQHRLDHVAGVDRPLGGSGSDDGVELVDEGDDLPPGLRDLLEDGLHPLLELTPVLRSGDHRGDVEGDDALVAQTLGDVTVGDATGDALDRRMALATTATAWSWPTTRWCSASSMRTSFCNSPSMSLLTGIPVERACGPVP